MTIRQKLRFSVLLLVVAFVTMTGTIAYTFRSVHREAAHVAAVNHTVRMVFELGLLGYDYQAYREERAAVQWRATHRRLGQILTVMAGDRALSETQDVLRRLHDNHTLIGTLFETVTTNESPPEATRLSGQSLLLRSNVMVADAHQLADASNQAAATQTDTLLRIFIGSLAPLALACVFVFVANHRILSSLVVLDAGATAIGNGHLTHTLRVTGQDEFAALTRTINTMAAQLYTGITQREHIQAQAAESLEAQNRLLADTRDQALQATRAKSAFLASMSHEIRTPMNAILGMADLLEETPLTSTQLDYVQRFKRAGSDLLILINDILDLSKIEADQLELEQTPFDLDELLNTVAELMAVRAQAKGLELRCAVAPDVPTHRLGDPHRLRQILVNLLSNAIKFTDTGAISLRVAQEPKRQEPERLRFSVRDTGIGIPTEKLEAIFESFTQVDTSTTRQYGGTGLGLSISKKLAALMDGRIWAESHLGQGSTFHLTVQCALNPTPPALLMTETCGQPAAGPPLPPLTPPPPGAAPARGLAILLAEDNADNQLLIQLYLKHTAHHLTLVENGAVALDRFKAGHYDLVLMDIQMPVMDGYTATTRMRQWEQVQHCAPTLIIALTANALPEDRQQSLDAGCDGHLSKPIKKAALLAALADYAGRLATA